MSKLKVLFFYQDFGAMGGIERWIAQTARWLSERGPVEPVIACCENTPFYRSLQDAGLAVYGLPNRPLFGRSILRSLDIPTFMALARIIRQEKPDLLHVHIGLLENLLFKAFGLPVVYSFHGYSTLYSMQDTRNPIKLAFKRLTRAMFRKTARDVDALLFVSGAEQARMLHEGYLTCDRPGEVLHNGLPIKGLKEKVLAVNPATVKRELGIPEESHCVSFINRLDANKNPLEFVNVARRLSAELPDLHFLVAGDGPLLPDVINAAADLPNVHVLGFRSDVENLLAVSDLLIHPALREGFGMALVEAMASGVPCVTYASGGAIEILDFAEIDQCLVPIGDQDGLYVTAKAMLTRPAAGLRQLKEALRQRASAFNEQRFMEKLEAVYARLLPKVSVILPVYNGEASIQRAVRSVLNQSYPHLELIVVDDGSTDSTQAKLAEINDPRLKVLHQSNQGVAAARNLGFQHAKGNWIGFIDADDAWLPGKLETEIQVMRRQGAEPGMVYSSYYAVDDQNRLFHLPPIRTNSGVLSAAVLEDEGLFLPSTTLVHRAVFEAVGSFKSACYHEDRVFFIEACQQFPAWPTGKRLVAYRQSTAGRCRGILKDFDQALSAELSIVDTLRPVLDEQTLEALSMRQLRNLLFRFLMYNYPREATKVYAMLKTHRAEKGLFSGKKGLLARLSMTSGINFLYGLRLCIQNVTRLLGAPAWFLKTRALGNRSVEANDLFTTPAMKAGTC